LRRRTEPSLVTSITAPLSQKKIFSFWFLIFFHWFYTPKRLLSTEHISRINICLSMSKKLEKNGNFYQKTQKIQFCFFPFLKINFLGKKSKFSRFSPTHYDRLSWNFLMTTPIKSGCVFVFCMKKYCRRWILADFYKRRTADKTIFRPPLELIYFYCIWVRDRLWSLFSSLFHERRLWLFWWLRFPSGIMKKNISFFIS
jgi:hypothetical protein